MNLKLYKPLCVFDLETTGTNVGKDRIVEICILKVNPDASRESKTWKVNPEMPIPKESSAIHGIYDEDVVNAPTFKDIASKILEMISGSDLGGFNSNRFDVPLLAEELLRAGLDFDLSKFKLVDAQTIYHKMEPRNLSAAYNFYCQKTLENAHSAEADVLATFEVLDAQVGHYEDLPKEVAGLSEFSFHSKFADLAGMIHFNDKDQEIFAFGKYKGQVVKEVFQKDIGYYGWLQSADFPLYTKKIFTKIQLKSRF
ncbi:exonuclease domain-containing protein [Epilithonimonas ginsengisoli]|uniref:Exonuclease domain-containing protein n=1 Tax=Epilithonimonas ginsengisoli TaxID=1245592 RepID=A0ABU4JMY5_9FLAO|nr:MULTISPECIES: 3'-5' exonuclease [Chryseobacterium group]MBV6881935.1 3'-5' exonuclease [Epilithonimonas sp. FP105]MDW8551012.1 exonuclease domain-containing protein [Epilithonimonas ginsengisoli]OAH65934.1 DNA polymerase III subunit epsilon [Chryseobacterium sp. FP211-J200]